MKTYARIHAGRVAELFQTDKPIADLFHPSIQWAEADASVQVGWVYDGAFSAPVPEVIEPHVPQVVSAFQAQAALDDAGLLASVEAMMADPATPKRAKLAWKKAQEFRRTSPTVKAMAQALGLDDAALDALFTAAAEIQA